MKKYAKLAMLESMRSDRRTEERDRRMDNRYQDGRTEYRMPPGPIYMDGRDMESRFRDGDGRDRYDDGRYATENDVRYYRPMGRIGFERTENRREFDYNPEMGSEVRQRRRDEMEHRGGEREMGHAHGAEEETFTRDTAERWVRSMVRADGERGEKFTIDEVRAMMEKRGVGEEPYKVWAAMNAEYADRCRVNERYGMVSPEFYLDSAVAFWFKDRDAVRDKLGAYYRYIAKHE